jgi:hypothetical protein
LNLLEYDALLKRKHIEDDRARLNAGFIYAAIHNTASGADPNREAVQPTDIVPSMRVEKHPDLRGMSGEKVKAILFGVFMGGGKKSM